MNKKFLKIIMSFLLAIAVVPSIALAEDSEAIKEAPEVEVIKESEISNRSMLATSGSSEQSSSSIAYLTSDETVTYYDSMSDAISAAAAGDTVTLLSNVSLTNYQLINKAITLDLGGYTVTGGSDASYVFAVTTDGVTIENGTVQVSYYIGLYAQNGSITIDDLTINANTYYGTGVYLGNSSYNYYGNLTMEDGCKIIVGSDSISNSGNYGVQISSIDYSSNNTSTFTMNGGSIETYQYGMGVFIGGSSSDSSYIGESYIRTYIYMNGGSIVSNGYYGIVGNGASHNTYIEINGGNIQATNNGTGIFHPQWGILKITDGSVIATNTAIEMRAGTLNISGGTFEATETGFGLYASGSGTSVYGAAIAISQHTTQLDIDVSISGGTFKGVYALYEQDLMDDSTTNVSMSLSGGKFISTGSSSTVDGSYQLSNYPTYKKAENLYQAVYSENNTSFITGGEFLSEYTSSDGTITLTSTDLDFSYVDDECITVYVNETDTTYVGTVENIITTLNALSDIEKVTLLDAGKLTNVALTGLDGITVSSLITDSVTATINGLTVTTSGIITHPDAVHVEAAEATCTEDGNIEYWYCEDCDKYFSDEDCQKEITDTSTLINGTATGHDYKVTDWSWSDDLSSATATITCANDSSHTYTETATVTSKVTTEATYTSEGVRTYTATVTVDGTEYTDTKTESIDKLELTVVESETTAQMTVTTDEDGNLNITIESTVDSDTQKISIPLAVESEDGTSSLTGATATTESEDVTVEIDEDGNLVITPVEGLESGDYTVTVTITMADGTTQAVVVTFTYDAETDEASVGDGSVDVTADSTVEEDDDEDSGSSTTIAATSSDTDESADTDTSDNTVMYIYALLGLMAACGSCYVIKRREEL